MESFEVHITGDARIHESAKLFGMNTIEVQLLRPDLSVIRVEHMTSHVFKFPTFQQCVYRIEEVADMLSELIDIVRIKIECPVYEHYIHRSLYLESHFDLQWPAYPTSRNARKTKLMGTDRTYDRSEYPAFREKWEGQVLELALYDTFIDEDNDWLSLWPASSI